MQDKIRAELTESMKAKEATRVSVLRGLIAAFTNESVAKGRKPDEKLSDEEVVAVIRRAVKQRKDSIEQFEKGGRMDLSDKEKAELSILETYLPHMMSREEIESVAKEVLARLGSIDKSKSGMAVGAVMKVLKGRADGADVKAVVDALLA